MGGAVKLSVTAEQINNIPEISTNLNKITADYNNRFSSTFHDQSSPKWFRICRFTSSSGCCGRVAIQTYWNYTRENSLVFYFKAGWGMFDKNVLFMDNGKFSKIRIVRHKDQPVSYAYIDVHLSAINNSEVFEINTEVFNTNAAAFSGNIEADIPENYIAIEYDIT